MLEGFRHLFAARAWSQVLIDLLDIIIVAYVVYRALIIVRGTRAMQMATGLGVIFLVYIVSKWAGLVTLFNLLSTLLSSIILISVVVFQNDIRRGLMRVGSRAFLGGMGPQQESRVIDEVVAAANELARHRMGALICFEQDANLDEFVAAQGTSIDAAVQRDLLVSLFIPESVNKLHDGAVVIRALRVARAGVFFPMPDTRILDKSLGSRHRAALGITEETDAVVVVVSEERGTISCCFNGNIVPNLDGPSLKQVLLGLFGRRGKAQKKLSKKLSTGSFRITLPPGTPTSSGTGSVKIQLAPQGPDEESVPAMRVTMNPEESHPLPPTSTPAVAEASRSGPIPDADDSQPIRRTDPSVVHPMAPSPEPSQPPPSVSVKAAPLKTPAPEPAPGDAKD